MRTTLIQPMDKDKLDDYKGKLNDNRILELDDLIIDYLGMLSADDDNYSSAVPSPFPKPGPFGI
ncbi:hypothetical protein HMPREF3149_09030 [Corynebacterium sp. HMSC05E07]|nr:hypothetical protein HMPREF3149_09030 [Corynebacterium sp. HMSC05E07]